MALPRAVADCLPHNPGLDEDQAHRACIAEPVPDTLAAWDALASAIALKNTPATRAELAEKYGMVLLRPSQPKGCLCHKGGDCTGRCGWVPLTLPNLQLYVANCSARVARQALCAGFFPFGSEFHLPGVALAERSFLNFELVGEGAGRENGRVVLDLAGGGVLKGRKARRGFIDCVEPVADSTVDAWCADALRATAASAPAASGTLDAPLRGVMTVNRAFEAVHSGIVAAKGTDWMGFMRVRRMLALLQEHTGSDRSETQLVAGVRLVSTELWDASTGRLVGGTVGFVVGAAYSMLSLYDLAGAAMPEVGRGLVQATVLRLHHGGVQLFDAGTTAGYFQDLYGFRRTTRYEFLRLWRKHRRDATSAAAHSTVWADSCTTLHTLLCEGSQIGAPATSSCRMAVHNTRATAKRPRTTDASTERRGKLPSAVVLTGDFEKSQETEAAVLSALARCGEVVRCIVKTGMAIVQFSTAAEAEAAVRLSGNLKLNAPVGLADGVVQICMHVQRKKAKAQKG